MRRRKKRVVYMAHPVSGDVENNISNAKRWYRWIIDNHDVAVLANWIIDCELYDNNTDYEASLQRDEEIACRCDEVWLVGGRISEGMRREANAAENAGVTVVDLTKMGYEPPEVTSND